MNTIKWIPVFFFAVTWWPLQAQLDEGSFSGGFQANGNWFVRDSEIGADNTPQYDNELFGAEAWLDLNYSYKGFDMGVRFDLFNNSNLLNPTGSFTGEGIGRWYIHKQINNLDITVGYLYDQIGSGVIYRAYEERALLIDNALFGGRVAYEFLPDWRITAFTGKQKKQFDFYGPIVKGAYLEGFIAGPEGSSWTVAPGVGFVNRTYDDATVDRIVSVISSYLPEDQVQPTYNTYAMTLYNNLTYGPISWYVEGAYKSEDIFPDPFAVKQQLSGGTTLGKLVKRSGTVFYTSLGYADHGWGISVEGKRTEDFRLRIDPFVTLNNGFIGFIPPMVRQNTYRLTARYLPATQELGELAYQVDVSYSPSRKWRFGVNYSNIKTLDEDLLYRELFTEVTYKPNRTWQLIGGVQTQKYNQEVFEGKPEVPIVETWTPYVELLYKFSRKKALRVELQNLSSGEDFGSWLFFLAEFSIAPNWVFEVSDMYNYQPEKTGKIHYPTVGVYYTQRSNRFGFRYVKQVEGIVCSGGICRLEPAFSGVKASISSTF